VFGARDKGIVVLSNRAQVNSRAAEGSSRLRFVVGISHATPSSPKGRSYLMRYANRFRPQGTADVAGPLERQRFSPRRDVKKSTFHGQRSRGARVENGTWQHSSLDWALASRHRPGRPFLENQGMPGSRRGDRAYTCKFLPGHCAVPLAVKDYF